MSSTLTDNQVILTPSKAVAGRHNQGQVKQGDHTFQHPSSLRPSTRVHHGHLSSIWLPESEQHTTALKAGPKSDRRLLATGLSGFGLLLIVGRLLVPQSTPPAAVRCLATCATAMMFMLLCGIALTRGQPRMLASLGILIA
jgi:hypothetical protein